MSERARGAHEVCGHHGSVCTESAPGDGSSTRAAALARLDLHCQGLMTSSEALHGTVTLRAQLVGHITALVLFPLPLCRGLENSPNSGLPQDVSVALPALSGRALLPKCPMNDSCCVPCLSATSVGQSAGNYEAAAFLARPLPLCIWNSPSLARDPAVHWTVWAPCACAVPSGAVCFWGPRRA